MELTRRMQRPNVVACHAASEDSNWLYLLTDFACNQSLAHLLDGLESHRVPERAARSLLSQAKR